MSHLIQRVKEITGPFRIFLARLLSHADLRASLTLQEELKQTQIELEGRIEELREKGRRLAETEFVKTWYEQVLSGIWEEYEVAADALPSMLITSLPKSGTVYLANLLYHGLNATNPAFSVRICSHGLFPRDLFCQARLRAAYRGNALISCHVDASEANVHSLRLYHPRLQVHLRDPRQASLSFLHHCLNYFREGKIEPGRGIPRHEAPFTGPYVHPALSFYGMSLEEQIDWAIEHQLPRCVTWIGEWLQVIDSGAAWLEVLLTTYEEFLRQGERAFVERILDFFGVPQTAFRWPEVPKQGAVHYRQGTADEWLHVFTARQRERATRLVPVEWRDRFGWPGTSLRTLTGPISHAA